jgi:uncharacterized RDD family membrane protein YckC
MSDLPPPPPDRPPPPPPSFTAAAPPPGYQAYGAPTAQRPLAGFGSRLGGWLIDAVVIFLFFLPAIVALVAGPTEIEPCSVDSSGVITSGGELNALCEGPTDGTIAIAVLLGIAGAVATIVYEVKLIGGPSGATWGMRAVSIRAVDANTGGPIGAGRAFGRMLFASFISSFFFNLGYLWNIWDAKKQTWHDKVTTTIVVKD